MAGADAVPAVSRQSAAGEERCLRLDEILAAEYRVLRPQSGFDAGTEAQLFSRMHVDPKPLCALCLSGGGIRSATFALGAIQGLAERGLLPDFDYLSTVSGGGYIGGWLTAWAHRAGDIWSVVPGLRRDAPKPAAGEPDPIQHLRDYNSYLSPSSGAFSSDVWTLIATVLRNIFLNWLVLIPLLAFVLILPRFFVSALSFPELRYHHEIFDVAPPDGCPEDLDPETGKPLNYCTPVLNRVSQSIAIAQVVPTVSVLLFATALFNILRYLPGVGGEDHSPLDFTVKVVGPLVGAVITALLFDALYYLGSNYTDKHNEPWQVLGWTTAPCLAAWILYVVYSIVRGRRNRLFGALPLAIVVMAAGTGAATWLTTNLVLPQTSWPGYVTLGPPSMLLGFCAGSALFVGVASGFLEDDDREWMSRALAGVLLFSVAWAMLCGMVLVLPIWVLRWHSPWMPIGIASAAAVVGWLSTSRQSSVTNANPGAGVQPVRQSPLLSVGASLAPPLFVALLAGALSVFTNILLLALLKGEQALGRFRLGGAPDSVMDWHNHYAMLTRSDPSAIVLLAIMCLGLGVIMSRWVNINTFSLHEMYRDRLIRAYLGASNRGRTPSRFTGFSRTDDVPMASIDPRQRPIHVVNVTLNLVGGSRLAWRQRKAAPFTITPLHSGSAELGYRPSTKYGGGITLGTAVAISGAAASPNMGYHSSPIVAFIMTLFNARLGSWLGHPGDAGAHTWTQPGPLSATGLLVKEALGQTSDRTEYVYLSDGGHFENLALYEMVRRRCKTIVVFDGACDKAFQMRDLGNALRKIRIDLQIPIEFGDHERPLRARSKRCAIGVVRYSVVDGPGTDGTIIYVKPMLLGSEPPDVASYAATHPDFPHQSTGDQWFDESQTESYRLLGLLTIDEMCAGWNGTGLADFCRHIQTDYLAGDATSADRPYGTAAAS
jgi:patatin-like phospholipase